MSIYWGKEKPSNIEEDFPLHHLVYNHSNSFHKHSNPSSFCYERNWNERI